VDDRLLVVLRVDDRLVEHLRVVVRFLVVRLEVERFLDDRLLDLPFKPGSLNMKSPNPAALTSRAAFSISLSEYCPIMIKPPFHSLGKKMGIK
jgi:hypothetical protein